MRRITLILFVFISCFIQAQKKIIAVINSTQDTIYHNEGLCVKYYASERLSNGFSSFPQAIKQVDSLFTQIVCASNGDSIDGMLYIGCSFFEFKRPGWNNVPKVFFVDRNTDTLYSSNNIKVFVLDKALDEKHILRKNNIKGFTEDSLNKVRELRYNEIVDSLTLVKCSNEKSYLISSQSKYFTKVDSELIIQFETNYLCIDFININYIFTNNHNPEFNSDAKLVFDGSTNDWRSNLDSLGRELYYRIRWFETTGEFTSSIHYSNDLNVKEIVEVFQNYERKTYVKYKLQFNRIGTYKYKFVLLDKMGKVKLSKKISVIVTKK